MEGLTKKIAETVRADCQSATAGSLGVLLGSPVSHPYNFVHAYPPENFTGVWITYYRDDMPADQSRFVETSQPLWHFAIWYKKQGTSLDGIITRLRYVLENKTFSNNEGSASKFKLLERGNIEYDDDRKAYFQRVTFNSFLRLFLREK